MENNENLAYIALRNINKIYPNGNQAVFDFSLDVDQKDFIVLVGPSGCGKTTTLRMIAGLEEISSGFLYLDQKLSNFVESKNRNIAMVFQSYALYPSMDVYNNMAFGLNVRGIDKKEIEARVFEAAKSLDLGNYLDRKPKELSGGQMQRVALGRAIVRKAPIFLMDEPLSNLDAKLRVAMRSEIIRIHQQAGSTTIYVTHDQIEAMTMATKMVVMNKGFIQQIGTPEDIYSNPHNSFVASFIGTPAMNLFYATYKNGNIIVNSEFKLTIQNLATAHDKFYSTLVSDLGEKISNFDHECETYLKHLKSNNILLESPITIVQKNKSKSIFSKLIRFFKKSIKRRSKEIEPKINPSLIELQELQQKANQHLNRDHRVLVGIRPEKMVLRKVVEGEDLTNKIVIIADVVELLGAEYNIYFNIQDKKLIVRQNNEGKIKVGDRFVLEINENDIYVFDDLTGKKINFFKNK